MSERGKLNQDGNLQWLLLCKQRSTLSDFALPNNICIVSERWQVMALCFALPEQVPIRGLELVNRVEHQGLAYAKGSIGDCYHQLLP